MRALVIAAALVLMGGASSRAQSSALSKHLEVVIVSVENFDDAAYSNAILETNMHRASSELEVFFAQNFPTAHVTVRRSHDETTFASLSSFFRSTFRQTINGNVGLLFVLSHGEALQPPNPSADRELRIVASDTSSANIAGGTLSVASDIIGNLNSLSPGSFLFGFIDTCHAGAAASIGLSLDAALKDALGVKTMIMASSPLISWPSRDSAALWSTCGVRPRKAMRPRAPCPSKRPPSFARAFRACWDRRLSAQVRDTRRSCCTSEG